MAYVVMARRYRPQTFEEVVGQETIARTLKNAVRLERIGHAFLFAGPRGVGKTSTARILAKALNCEKGPTPEPCGKCSFCEAISAGNDMDVVEIDAASNNSVDDVRALRENVQYATSRARYKVYIIDEVHMLSNSAFNALLRTLEEPPEHVKFIFATTEPQRLPETIRSRCQRFDFRPVGVEPITERLRSICEAEGIEAADEALAAMARRARGSVRDAQSLLDQIVTYADGKIELEHVEDVVGSVGEGALFGLAGAVCRGDPAAAVREATAILDAGGDPVDLVDELAAVFHAALEVAVLGGEASAARPEFAHRAGDLAEMASGLGPERLLYAVRVLSNARAEAAEAPRPHIPLEAALIKLSRIDDLVELSKLASGLGPGGSPAGAGGGSSPEAERAGGGGGPSGRGPKGAGGGDSRPRNDAPAGEAPAPVERPAALAEGEALSPERAAGLWALVVEEVSEGSKPLGTLLADGEFVGVEGKTVIVSFDRKMVFHKEQVEERSRLAKVNRAAREVFGRPVQVRFVRSGGPARAPGRTMREAQGRAVSDAAVQRVLEKFGGEIMRISRREEAR